MTNNALKTPNSNPEGIQGCSDILYLFYSIILVAWGKKKKHQRLSFSTSFIQLHKQSVKLQPFITKFHESRSSWNFMEALSPKKKIKKSILSGCKNSESDHFVVFGYIFEIPLQCHYTSCRSLWGRKSPPIASFHPQCSSLPLCMALWGCLAFQWCGEII